MQPYATSSDPDAGELEKGSAVVVACVRESLNAAKISSQSGASLPYSPTIDGVLAFRTTSEYTQLFSDIVRWILSDGHVPQKRIGEASDVREE